MFARITWTDSKWAEDGMFEFSQVGTFPPFDSFVENPNPMRSKNKAHLFARKYLTICQQAGWVVNPNQSLEDVNDGKLAFILASSVNGIHRGLRPFDR